MRINPFNTGINPVTFQVDPQEDFIDLTESFFEVEFMVKKDNATNLLQGDVIGLVNNLVHSLFKQIIARLNGTLISPQRDTYHYKAFLEAILNHVREDGKTILVPEGWYNSLDVPDDGEADEYTANVLDNATPKKKAQAPVVRKPISANPRLNRLNPRNKFVLRLNSVPRSSISTIQGLN